MKNNTMKEIALEFERADSIVIFPHILMDGDALGSSAALCRALREKGKNAVIAIEDKIPDYIKFLDNDYCVNYYELIDAPDISVCVDCGDYTRFRKRVDLFESAKTKICIDHHPTSEGIGDFNYIDGKAAATGELIYDLIKQLNVTIDSEMSDALFTAITTDTGNFQYSNTTKRTHEIVMDLYDHGLDAYGINIRLYENEPISKIKLHSLVLSKAEIFAGGNGIIVSVTQDMLKQTNTLMEDTEGIVSKMRSIKGVEVAILLKEEAETNIKVSMRSKEELDVAKISVEFGGGGHVRAAGCTIREPMDIARKKILDAIKSELCKVF